MNEINAKLSGIKFKSIEQAVEHSIPVVSSQSGKIVAYLLPVGEWVLSQTALLMSIAKWRKKFMRFYLTQSETDLKSTTEYIQSKIHHDSSAIFFMIADEQNEIIGHIGFSNITAVSAELDNILLGEYTAIKDLMKDVELQSIDWIRNFLNIERIFLRVLSYNFLAINLHQECGFSLEQLVPIKRMQYSSKFIYEPCKQDETDLEFHLLVMSKNLKDVPIV